MTSTCSGVSMDLAREQHSARNRLFARLKELGIETRLVPYPAHKTVEEGKALRGELPGTFTKNLLLKDKKSRHFLLSVHEDRVLDLKTLHRRIDATGRLGFASPECVTAYLGVLPGALTPLALINDRENRVIPVIDASLMRADQVNFHPLLHTESMGLRPDHLLAFIRACEREPMIVDFDQPAPD